MGPVLRETSDRRRFLAASAAALRLSALSGPLGLSQLCSAAVTPDAPAKAVIHLYMEGGPSQVDTFDPKPSLKQRAGESLPFDKPSTVFNSSSQIMPSPFKFRQYGQNGTWVSELFPHVAEHVDDLCFVHSLHHEASNHSSACYMTHTGATVAGRPCLGSWMSYGLGSENENLPSFVVLDSGQAPSGGAATWSHGFLPADFSCVKFMPGDVSVEFLQRLETSSSRQQSKLEAIQALQQQRFQTSAQPHVRELLQTYERAARMQATIPEVTDLSSESHLTQQAYGLDDPATKVFGSRCLLARRLVERGVRCVEVFSPRVAADRWDQHGQLEKGHRLNSRAVDKPIAGLLQDLKARGLLSQTLVLWGGEFGRTPTSQGGTGRDHNPFGYTAFLAGGGVRAGAHYGATDEFGYYAVENRVHLHDLHATILHQLGIDHEQLTFRHGGRDYRLTDVHGKVVRGMLL